MPVSVDAVRHFPQHGPLLVGFGSKVLSESVVNTGKPSKPLSTNGGCGYVEDKAFVNEDLVAVDGLDELVMPR